MLVPGERIHKELEDDYQAMRNMIYGNIPEFKDILMFLEGLQAIQHREYLLLSGWTLLEKEYIDVTEKVYDEDGTMVALINYYFLNENKDRMMIALFEVFKPYRDRGLGKRIIAQFLQDYYGEVNLEPSGEQSESFWKQCGFESGCYLDRRCK